ncbi:activator of 90 kDa heat shock protein ATPase homolog 1-like [Sycon ciliatum]|uniref:activator of 90 kDa heat shock protein ATPase homolog 1-like n=1 Tax=Sycon ciliatum TaxID=27933 RepID=UPI0020AD3A8C|eukprot:scpid65685/ scgid14359/ Activator of 90 kDa heat shock protein ATPase homolog 1; p38
MAKWGEGDPRWIVEARPDGTNVNNWHWTEKNASHWSNDRLKQLLVGLTFDIDLANVRTTELSKCDGEATVNNRKAKLIFFYEWDVSVKWTGRHKDSDEDITGSIQVPNLSDENDADDLDITVSCKSNSKESSEVRQMMQRMAIPKVRNQLASYVRELKEEYGKDMILPTNKGSSSPAAKPSAAPSPAAPAAKSVPGAAPASSGASSSASSVSTSRVQEKCEFQAAPEDVFNVFVDKERTQAFTRGSAQLEPTPGGKFTLLGGNVEGNFVELVRNEKIVQKWRMNTWPSGHYSTVTLLFTSSPNGCLLKLKQDNVPTSSLESTKEGWHRYYFESIKMTFGFGAALM